MGGERRQHRGPGAPACRGRAEQGGDPGSADPAAAAVPGRRRGGLTTKLHLAYDGKGRPLAVVLTPGQRHDGTQLEPLLDAIRVPRPADRRQGGPLRALPPRAAASGRRGIPPTIPERSDQRERRATRPGRKPACDRAAYRRRNVVERCVNRLKQWREIATRDEKRAANYRGMVVSASLLIRLGQ